MPLIVKEQESFAELRFLPGSFIDDHPRNNADEEGASVFLGSNHTNNFHKNNPGN